MWFLGVILGLIIGGITGSVPAALVLAIIGGFVAHQLAKGKQDSKAKTPPAAEPPAVLDLRQKIALLEARLSSVERQLAQRMVAAVESNAEVKPGIALNQAANQMASAEPAPILPVLPVTKTDEAVSSPVVRTTPDALSAIPKVAAVSTLERLEVPKTPKAIETVKSPPPVIARPPAPVIPFKDRLPEPIRKLIYGGNTLVKIGVLILFLGLAFLLRYTAERVTVPVELRYAAVAMVGAGLLALGWFLRRRRADYALIMQGMGIGVFYLTTLAAMKFHQLIPSEAGFAFMFLISILGAALAILQNAPALAIIAALEGFATPILTSTGGNHMLGLFTYLSILDLGIVLVAWFNAWRVLNVIGFVGTFTLASGWANQYYSDAQYAPVQAFLIFFFLLFTAVGVFFARRTLLDTKSNSEPAGSLAQQAGAALVQVGRVDSALVFGTPLTAFGLQYMLSKPWEFGPAFSAMAISAFYLILARLIFSPERKGLALLAEAYAIVGVIFATLAVPLGLEGSWTGAAWAVEGAGMYWLGVRQHRPYARAFAYVVLLGASYKLVQAISVNPAAEGALLHGSAIGPILLAISAFAMWRQHRRAGLDALISRESFPGRCLPWLGLAALTILPWQWFTPPLASAATAALSVVTYFIARRFDLKALFTIVGALQAVAVASFVSTLHSAPDLPELSANTAKVVLDSGMQGMLAALTIAASILLTAGWSMAQARRNAMASGAPPAWSIANSIAVVTGTGLLHLALLFAVSLQQAIIIWPITSCAVLWVALRMSHKALAAVAAGLQLISALIFILKRGLFSALEYPLNPAALPDQTTLAGSDAFAHLGFWTPLVLALVAWLCGDWIRAEAKRLLSSFTSLASNPASEQALPKPWFNLWCRQDAVLWLPVIWGLCWWLAGWIAETSRVLELRAVPEFLSAAIISIILITSFLTSVMARWRDWRQMGMASMFTLPALVLSVYLGVVGSSASFVPSAHLGWLVWPIALIWHLRLLQVQARWSLPAQRQPLHVVGFWFFLLLAARECQWRFAGLGEPMSSWALLGWVLMPAISFWLLRSRMLQTRWPLTEFRPAYLETASAPVAAYLLAWCFISNLLSSGNAAPLPYLPLVNPLELGQWMVMAALLLWWRALPEKSNVRVNPGTAQKIGAVMGLALITGMVLRSCHHFAGVAWNSSALFDSRLTQAALSITWAALGVLTMLLGNRRASRTVWAGGAALLAVVVVKLFVIELADRGGLYRIVSFIGVGVLLLVVGYFAPVPAPVTTARSGPLPDKLTPDATPLEAT